MVSCIPKVGDGIYVCSLPTFDINSPFKLYGDAEHHPKKHEIFIII